MKMKEVVIQGSVSALCSYLITNSSPESLCTQTLLSMADVLKRFANGDKVELIVRKIEE